MDDMDRALFEAFAVVWERLSGDSDELRARLARRRGAQMGRPPRAWCLAVRASDRGIEALSDGDRSVLQFGGGGGLLYMREVRRPEYWEAKRRRAYRRHARRAPSKRREEVRARVVAGMKVREIARELGIAVNTVAGHMKVIYRQAGVHSKRELREKAGAGGGAG